LEQARPHFRQHGRGEILAPWLPFRGVRNRVSDGTRRLNSLADARKMAPMSGPRLNFGRSPLAACIASCLLWFCGLASCTAPTPGYCNSGDQDKAKRCLPPLVCGSHFLCITPVDASDAATADRGDIRTESDAGTDAPADIPTTTGDGGNDLRDSAGNRADSADGPKACDGGCVADGGTPVCDTRVGACVGCLENPDCTGASARVCDKMASKCVQCVVAGDCHNANAPICGHQICRGCLTDSECTGIGPEVCMVHIDGHCATDDETVYVKNDLAKCMPDAGAPAGSSTMPFCVSQLAINATVPPAASDAGTAADASPAVAKDLVVMQGPLPLTEWAFGDSRTLTVVGKTGATISTAGTREGITISGGTVYLRDLRVNMCRTGIKASGGELHADRVTIDGNMAGGIFLDNTSFAINNSVIAGNVATVTGAGLTWSGVLASHVPESGPASLLNDTIVRNGTGAVACVTDTLPIPTPSRTRLAGLILWANGSDVLAPCVAPIPCCGVDSNTQMPLDPKLSDTWRLMSGSPCIDKVATSLTSYDIDGDPRPSGAASDCGADEFLSTTP
jgi:hypothetical protein